MSNAYTVYVAIPNIEVEVPCADNIKDAEEKAKMLIEDGLHDNDIYVKIERMVTLFIAHDGKTFSWDMGCHAWREQI